MECRAACKSCRSGRKIRGRICTFNIQTGCGDSFIKLDQIEEVKNALAEGDVVPGVCGPRVRTVTACQGAAICQSGCIDTYTLAKELDERYFGL